MRLVVESEGVAGAVEVIRRSFQSRRLVRSLVYLVQATIKASMALFVVQNFFLNKTEGLRCSKGKIQLRLFSIFY